MSEYIKQVEELTLADLEAFPVWEYTNEDGPLGETAVRPVSKAPLKHLDGRLIGTRIRLANGSEVWALICNVDAKSARSTQHFLTISVFSKGKWFHLARYHDVDSDERGPHVLAAFLNLPIEDVFPISYDLRRFSSGKPDALAGTIPTEPRERLTDAQLIRLAVP